MDSKKQKNMKKTVSILILAALCFSSCSEKMIPEFGYDRYIYLDGESQTFNFSFVSIPDDTYRLAIPLTFAGRPLTEDLTYAVKVDPSSTMEAGTEYEFPELIFRKGYLKDTLFLTLHRSTRMSESTFNLKFDLVSNENFQATQTGKLTAEVSVSAILSKPLWWDTLVEDNYLGEYSDKKYELFVQHGYAGDFGALEADMKYYYAMKFKQYLESNPQYDDGELITVPVVG